ncbi:olfactory receptor 2AG2-like [Perognathus longimembris pacificus]|uniref:olfactory receptor 2AG2-like n=1 Tax=Perognathus longimembris pacificus TaxID=214514 RepID=UPI00201891DE|nr:olfactory receptor 2AG2-like [Perognathus longimembris pacificus]
MELWSTTLGSSFILDGILNDSRFPELLWTTITILYMVALTSNGLLLLLITMDVRLHVPMCLLLRQLSLIDFLFTTVVMLRAIIDFLLGDNSNSLGCALQIFLELTLGGGEDLLLTFMADNRYVAICHLRQYMIFMRPKICWFMVTTSWILALPTALEHTIYTMHFPFCMSLEIRHLLCEISPRLKLACADTSTYELLLSF